MKRWQIGVGLVAAAALGVWMTRPPVPRHVVIISLDTTRADALGVYGGADAFTPEIDKFASQALVFDRHYSAAPTTLASHTALFTGNHPHNHGVPRNDYRVNDKNRMLQEVFSEAGFRTAAFLGAIPLGSHSNFTQGFMHVEESFSLHRKADGTAQSERPGDEVVAAVKGFLDDNAPEGDERLFLFVHLFDAHAPYWPDAVQRARLPVDATIEGAGSMDHITKVRGMLRRGDPDAARHVDTLRSLYLTGVSTLDGHVGELLRVLEDASVLDDALVVLTADHGETYAGHDEAFDHGETVYDETIHTPLILRFPGGWSGGDRIAEPVSNTDVFPSLIELFGLEEPPVDGHSLIPALRWPLWSRGEPVFAEATKPHVPDQKGWQNTQMHKAAVDGDWKLVFRPKGEKVELYNVLSDPAEQHNLRHEQTETAAELLTAVRAWAEAAHPYASPKVSSARVKAELEALGYVDGPSGGDEGAPGEAEPED